MLYRDYGSKSYWDSRYDELFQRQSTESTQSSLYEWYVGYEEIREILFAEIKGSPEAEFRVDRNISMLVAGCGNSSLCEDLSRDGMNSLYVQLILWKRLGIINNNYFWQGSAMSWV